MCSGGLRGCLLGLTLLSAGCLSPMTTRFPTWAPGHTQAERRAYELHDPFPDTTAAPGMSTRPPGFSVPRTSARQAVEGRVMTGLQPGLGSSAPLAPSYGPTGWRYPQVVPN